MASLSLALGMAEIAARSGGRIGSLYLDEGGSARSTRTRSTRQSQHSSYGAETDNILIVSHGPAIAQRINGILAETVQHQQGRSRSGPMTKTGAMMCEAAPAEV